MPGEPGDRPLNFLAPAAEIDGTETTRKAGRMLIALSVLGVILVAWLLLLRQAASLARAHAMTLSVRTGIPVGQICAEMQRLRLTPGEWAARHGLHPITFEPLDEPPGRAA